MVFNPPSLAIFNTSSGLASVAKSKSFGFYDDLVAIKNVRLLPLTFTSFDLIDKAKAVAAITGTVGFEAINRGKPVLIFGQNWYNGCEGVSYVQTAEECREALESIQNGYTIDDDKVKLFMYALEKTSIRAFLYTKIKGNVNISDEESIRVFMDALRKI